MAASMSKSKLDLRFGWSCLVCNFVMSKVDFNRTVNEETVIRLLRRYLV